MTTRKAVRRTLDDGRWIRTLRGVSGVVSARLICFPHAGGSASYFATLAGRVASGIEVLAVEYPGHLGRFSESMIDDLIEMADVICHLNVVSSGSMPLVLFGHSMGATIAYEVARRVEEGGRTLCALFVSSREGPGSRLSSEKTSAKSDEDLMDQVIAMGGLGSDHLAELELLEMTLPILRNDFHAIENYLHIPGEPLVSPIVALHGDQDTQLHTGSVLEWRLLTSGSFRLIKFSGGHFYLDSNVEQVASVIHSAIYGSIV